MELPETTKFVSSPTTKPDEIVYITTCPGGKRIEAVLSKKTRDVIHLANPTQCLGCKIDCKLLPGTNDIKPRVKFTFDCRNSC